MMAMPNGGKPPSLHNQYDAPNALTRSSPSGRDRPQRFVIRDHLELDARGFEQRSLRKHHRQRIHLVGVFD
jgi:hypothetical protein